MGCYRCHRRGHFAYECPEAQCSHYKKWGHVAGACPDGEITSSSEEGNLATTGTTNGRVIESWVLDSGAPCHMTFSLEGITDFLPCNKAMAGATGEEHRSEGNEKLRLQFVDENGTEEMVTLDGVAYVPALQHNLFSLMTAHKSGFSFATTPNGVSIFDGKLHLKSTGDVLVAHASRHFPVPVNPLGAAATLTPSHNPGTVIDINLFHCAFGHAHEDALRKTAER
ncbi:unnamed protein product, partial [Discosporangium mesarthrocarpum]